jgi:hypothetical protein
MRFTSLSHVLVAVNFTLYFMACLGNTQRNIVYSFKLEPFYDKRNFYSALSILIEGKSLRVGSMTRESLFISMQLIFMLKPFYSLNDVGNQYVYFM